MRAKWSAPIRRYWKISEQMMVKYCDLAICDSVNMRDGKADIHSEPVNEKARQQYPQRVKAMAKIDIPVGMSLQEALNRARISQTAINIEMIDMQKMIGDKIDPYQRILQP